MPRVTVSAARARLSALLDAALLGEEVIITRRGKAVARLDPVDRSGFKIGLYPELGEGPDFLEPMAPADLFLWEG